MFPYSLHLGSAATASINLHGRHNPQEHQNSHRSEDLKSPKAYCMVKNVYVMCTVSTYAADAVVDLNDVACVHNVQQFCKVSAYF
jgi:hypothetical protein